MCVQKYARKLVRDGMDGTGKYRKFSPVDEAIRKPCWDARRQNRRAGNLGNNPKGRVRRTPLCRHLTITGVDRQATRWAPASGEDNILRREEMEKGIEPASEVARKFKRIADRVDRPEGLDMDRVMAPSAGSYTGTTTAGISQGSASLNVEEALAFGVSPSSTMSRGRKRKLTSTTPDVSVELVLEIRTSSIVS